MKTKNRVRRNATKIPRVPQGTKTTDATSGSRPTKEISSRMVCAQEHLTDAIDKAVALLNGVARLHRLELAPAWRDQVGDAAIFGTIALAREVSLELIEARAAVLESMSVDAMRGGRRAA
jgi:hypothetical protein